MKAGDLMILSNGEYSDYSFSGPFRCVKNFEFPPTARAHADSFEQNEYDNQPDPSSFIAWLALNGYIEDVACTEIYLGSYGPLSIDNVEYRAKEKGA